MQGRAYALCLPALQDTTAWPGMASPKGRRLRVRVSFHAQLAQSRRYIVIMSGMPGGALKPEPLASISSFIRGSPGLVRPDCLSTSELTSTQQAIRGLA